jgi:hypothetical protein
MENFFLHPWTRYDFLYLPPRDNAQTNNVTGTCADSTICKLPVMAYCEL